MNYKVMEIIIEIKRCKYNKKNKKNWNIINNYDVIKQKKYVDVI